MSEFDFNDADPQRGNFDLLPDGAIVLVVTSLRPGQQGPGGWLKANKDGSCLMADFEFTIDGGDFDRRKIWSNWVTEGQTEGQQKAANITRSRLRAVLESARGIHPGDTSETAIAGRRANGWGDFDGLKFCARIGVEKDKTGQYGDKNTVTPVTPDEADYITPGPQTGGFQTAGAAAQSAVKQVAAKAGAAAGVAKPKWAS